MTVEQVPGPYGQEGRLLIAGDTHANLPWIRTLAKLAARHRCDGIVQLGDFGFWPDLHQLRSHRRAVINDGWLTAVADTVRWRHVWMRVVDGNHDWIGGVRAAYDPLPSGIVPIRDGLLDWTGRGTRWEWCGVTFGALGGAHSTDQDSRVPGINWWATETTTDTDVERLGIGPLDVLLTHDAPDEQVLARHVRDGIRPDPQSRANREKIEQARRNTTARLLLHGHFHAPYEDQVGETRVVGLGADFHGDGRAWGVLTLPSLRYQPGTAIGSGWADDRERRR